MQSCFMGCQQRRNQRTHRGHPYGHIISVSLHGAVYLISKQLVFIFQWVPDTAPFFTALSKKNPNTSPSSSVARRHYPQTISVGPIRFSQLVSCSTPLPPPHVLARRNLLAMSFSSTVEHASSTKEAGYGEMQLSVSLHCWARTWNSEQL